jgi:hypothetical protein
VVEEEEEEVEKIEKKKSLVLFSTTAQSFVFVPLHISVTYFSHHQRAIKLQRQKQLKYYNVKLKNVKSLSPNILQF